jgi:WD40 repeat protein
LLKQKEKLINFINLGDLVFKSLIKFYLISFLFILTGSLSLKSEPKSIFNLFNLEVHRSLPREIKDIIAEFYIAKFGWWYLDASLEHDGPVNIINFAKKTNIILTLSGNCTDRSTINLWNFEGNKLRSTILGCHISSAEFNNLSDKILVALWSKKAQILSIEGEPLVEFNHNEWVESAKFNDSEDKVLTNSFSKTARLWDLSGQIISKFDHGQDITSATFNSTYDMILTCSYDNNAIIWDLQGNEILRIKHDTMLIEGSFNKKSDKILTVSWGSNKNQVKVWDINGKEITTLKHDKQIKSALFLANDYILTASLDGTAKLWNLNGEIIATFNHNGPVNSAVFNQMQDKILTASDDGTAKLWDMNGNLLAIFNHNDGVHKAIFNKQGNKILTASYDNTVKLWSIYEKATLEQILLKKLFTLYFKVEKFLKKVETIEELLKIISQTFDLNEEELVAIWESLDEKVRNNLQKSFIRYVNKKLS